jgi:hypothetical protein
MRRSNILIASSFVYHLIKEVKDLKILDFNVHVFKPNKHIHPKPTPTPNPNQKPKKRVFETHTFGGLKTLL